MRGARVLVIGTERPWVEAALLAHGAASIVTLEYGAMTSTHPQVTPMTPAAIRAAYIGGELAPFDAVVSFSSVEHSGLGRYGDALNPWGDILAVARAWCVAKRGAKLLLAVPFERRDRLAWNSHRVYGPARYPHLVANWQLVVQMPVVGGARATREGARYWQRMHLFQRLD